MEEKKINGREWIEEHKSELVFVGVGIGTVLATIIGVKVVSSQKNMDIVNEVSKKQETLEALDNLTDKSKMIIPRVAHKVRMHLRKLPVGQKPSPEKVELAKKNGYTLLPGHTFVEEYSTREKWV